MTTERLPRARQVPRRDGGLTWRGIPVVLPNRRDPRLHVSVVILSLQVLGQVAFEFRVSVAQILVTIAACAVAEVAITFWRQRALIWPASALLTGNGVAFILRASGTEHGDWWSLNGIHFFVAAALLGLLSKYVLQVGGRHLFNPSNFGLVAAFLVVGPRWVFPQYLYWGEFSPPIVAALAVVLLGVVWILRPLRMLPMAASFLVPFSLLIAGLAAGGRCMYAVWHTGPVCGFDYWFWIVTSPELLIFVFYMMSDPKTAPRGPRARLVYGATTAVVASVMIAFQPTEYGVKTALLVALVAVCCVVPLIERWSVSVASQPRLALTVTPTVVAIGLILLAIPAAMTDLARDDDLLNLERGIVTDGNPITQ